MASSSCYMAVSKPRLPKRLFFLLNPSTISKPFFYRFSSSSPDNNKPSNEETSDPKVHLSSPNHKSTPLSAEYYTNPLSKIQESICRILEDEERLQNSIRNTVPLFDHHLVSSVFNRNPNCAFEFFQWVEEGLGFKNDRDTHYKIVEILCRDRKLDDAKRILFSMCIKGVDYDEDLFVLLIRSYAKSNRKWDIVKNCVKIFSKMEELRVPKTIKSYNPLLEVIISENKYTLAEKFFNTMLSEDILPTQHTYTIMISGLCRSSRVETANRFFQDMKSRNLLPDFVLYNVMINGYVQVKKMEDAEKLLMEMKGREIKPLLVTYNSMINGYSQVKKMEDAERLVVEIKAQNLEPNLITYNALINGYTLVEKMEDAYKLVLEMKGRNIEPDLVTYVTMIKGYVMVNRVDKALELLEEIKKKKFGKKVDVHSCLGRLKEDCVSEKMSETQRNVLQGVEDYIETVELLAMRDAARELSQLANQRVVDRQVKMKMDRETRGGNGGIFT